jgi:hypothetical protein
MDTSNARQGTRRTSARYQAITEDEAGSEDEYEDEVWPARPASSARRYQGQADVRTETGRVADVQLHPEQRRSARERHTVPPRRTATQNSIPALQTAPSSRLRIDDDQPRTTLPGRSRKARPGIFQRFHWLVFVGLALLIMIVGWIGLSALGTWWQTTRNDWLYGRPRTFQIDAVVGHHDSPQNPSHFIAMNLNRHIIIIEIPGGDASKSVIYSGPTLVGPGEDLTPVTLTFEDINHDGKLDMIVNIQGSQLVFLNENGTFVPAAQNQSGGS